MSHVDEGTLQAWIDGELTEVGAAEIHEHAARCATCSAELRALREADSRFHAALAELPASSVVADFATLREIRRRGRGTGLRRLVPASLARAAMLLLALAGVVAAAVPGSPLRRWLADVIEPEVAEPQAVDTPAVAPAVPAPVAPEPVQETGRFVAPDNGRIVVRLIAPAPGLEIHLRLVDELEAGVTWNAADEDARSRQTAGTLEVTGLDRGPVTIRIPRSVAEAIVEVDGRVWWQKQGADIRIPGPAHQDTGDGIVFQARS